MKVIRRERAWGRTWKLWQVATGNCIRWRRMRKHITGKRGLEGGGNTYRERIHGKFHSRKTNVSLVVKQQKEKNSEMVVAGETGDLEERSEV